MDDLRKKLRSQIGALDKDGWRIWKAESASHEREHGHTASADDTLEDLLSSAQLAYQSWYSRALPVVRQVLPDRWEEFRDLYRPPKPDTRNATVSTYTISDYLQGMRVTLGGEDVFDTFAAFRTKFLQQMLILRSSLDRLDSAVSDIRGVVQAEFSDGELAAAEDLKRQGHLRPAGVLAGVTLERHLAIVAGAHGINLRRKQPGISDYNEALKKAQVYDVLVWRRVQMLADLRNLCAHHKGREPTPDDVDDLIAGAAKVSKTVF